MVWVVACGSPGVAGAESARVRGRFGIMDAGGLTAVEDCRWTIARR